MIASGVAGLKTAACGSFVLKANCAAWARAWASLQLRARVRTASCCPMVRQHIFRDLFKGLFRNLSHRTSRRALGAPPSSPRSTPGVCAPASCSVAVRSRSVCLATSLSHDSLHPVISCVVVLLVIPAMAGGCHSPDMNEADYDVPESKIRTTCTCRSLMTIIQSVYVRLLHLQNVCTPRPDLRIDACG